MKSRKRSSCLLGAVAASLATILFASVPAYAEDGKLEVGRADEWHFNVTPYAWFAGLDGDITVKGVKSEADVGFDDILDFLDFGALGHVEATKGRWTIMTDVVYLKLSEDGITPGPVTVDVESETLIFEVGGGYMVRESESGLLNKPTTLEVLAGIRYTSLSVDLDFAALPTVSGSKDWVDPYVGFRTFAHWTPRWRSMFRADIGGFGVGSDLVYQVEFGQIIMLNPRYDVVFGFRLLDYDYEDGSGANKSAYDITMSGPFIGMNIKF